MSGEPLRLNIGSGAEHTLKGYVNIDIRFGTSAYPLEYPDNSVDEIRCSHTLEHFSFGELPAVLKDWMRALRPGGVMKIAVPDFGSIARLYLSGERRAPLFSYVMGGQGDENDYHKSLYDRISLEHYLTDAGLTDIQEWESEVKDCASLPISLNLMGRKPELPERSVEVGGSAAWRPLSRDSYPELKATVSKDAAVDVKSLQGMVRVRRNVRIGLALSMPAVSHTHTWQCIVAVAVSAQMPVVTGGGAFWHHALTRSIEELLAYRDEQGNPLDYILTADYDSIFNLEDVRRLATHLAQWDELGAVVPLQMKRERDDEPLFESFGPADLTESLVRIRTGHFGLTMFKREFFERLQRPWFPEKPDADGRWTDGRVDADIGFWRNAEDCGLVTCLATDVKIGHYQRLIVWPKVADNRVTAVHQYLTEWEKAGRVPPEGVWSLTVS